jgi:hypothetical protein
MHLPKVNVQEEIPVDLLTVMLNLLQIQVQEVFVLHFKKEIVKEVIVVVSLMNKL